MPSGAAFTFLLPTGRRHCWRLARWLHALLPPPLTPQPQSFHLSPASLCSSKSGKSTYDDDSVPYTNQKFIKFSKGNIIDNSFQIISMKYINMMSNKMKYFTHLLSPRCRSVGDLRNLFCVKPRFFFLFLMYFLCCLFFFN